MTPKSQSLQRKIEKILSIQSPIYIGTSGKGINATKQLLALFEEEIKEEWFEGYEYGYKDGLKMKKNINKVVPSCPKCEKEMQIIEKSKYHKILGCKCMPKLRLSIG